MPAPSTAAPLPARPPEPAAPAALTPADPALTADKPVIVEAAAPDGSWVQLCYASADTNGDGRVDVSVGPNGALGGDELSRALVLTSGALLPVDDVLAASDDGQRLIVTRGAGLFLVEPARSLEQPLTLDGADVRREPGALRHRTLALSGRYLFYVRQRAGSSELVARDLETGTERVEYTGPEPIVDLTVHAGGERVVLRIAGADTNGNGRFDWPFVPRTAPRPCQGPIPRFVAPRQGADALSAVVVDRARRVARRVDDLVMPFGASLLRRGSDGSLFVEDSGHKRVLADSACAGWILFADPARDQVVLGCSSPKKPNRLVVELVSGDKRLPLDIDVAALAIDEPPGPERRLIALYPGADCVILDLMQRRLVRLQPGDAVIATSGPRALVRRGRTAFVFDVDAGAQGEIWEGVDPFGGVLVQGDLAYVSPFVVDLRTGERLGRVPGPGLALTTAGAVLVPAVAAAADRLARGPLGWRVPQ